MITTRVPMLLILAAQAITLPAQSSPSGADSTAITKLDQRYLSAIQQQERAALNEIMSSAYWEVSPGGRMVGKTERLESILARKGPINQIKILSRDIAWVGGLARVSGVYEVNAVVGGKDVQGWFRFVRLYLSESGRWRLITDHDVQLAKETLQKG